MLRWRGFLSRWQRRPCGLFFLFFMLVWLVVMPGLILSSFVSFGVGGSRAASPACLAAAFELCGQFSTLGVSAPAIFTSCASGASSCVRQAFPGCFVARASDFKGLGAAAFARRAAVLIQALAAAPVPVWCCFPGCAAPAGLAPARRWQSCGSGSWSECSLAFGLGVPVLVFLPAAVQPPAAWGAWQSVAPGWFFLPLPPAQPTLF
ncbi:MAG: hypothetical protein KAX50_06010 [Saprospiraceae bacterium]|nr:hypothetical protein [Saprospiraceae bacterium]